MFKYTINRFRNFLSRIRIEQYLFSELIYSKKVRGKKGIALLLVLGTLLVIIVLANIVVGVISSQSRFTHHQISRIQAYYAAFAGMNLAFERLRTGNWTAGTYRLCKSGCSGLNVTDTNIPYNVTINIGTPNTTTGIRTVNLTTNYTYTP